MTGGLLQLASYGIQDEILIANPEITFFKTVFRKYTNFSIDTLHTLHDAKYGSNIDIKVPKTGDLLYKLFIKLDLPKVIAYYSESLYDIIYKIVSDESYNYTIDIYNKNLAAIKNLVDYINCQINSLNNDKMITDFFLYIGSDNNLKKLYNIYESSNMMNYDINPLNGKVVEKSDYFLDREIIQPLDKTDSNPYNYKTTNFLNENNYYITTDITYILNFAKTLKSTLGTIYLDKYNENCINKMLLNCMLELAFDKINYKLETSFNYYNKFKEQLYINSMPNEFLRQEYMTYKHGSEHIDDIMIDLRATGKIKTLDNYLDDAPKFLVFCDKTDPSILVPIIITDIFNYTPSSFSTQSTRYYDYTGYIANINYFNELIRYTNALPSYIIKTLKFDKVVLSKKDFKHKIININLPLITTGTYQPITITKSADDMSFLYRFTVNISGINTNGNLTQTITELIQSIKALKYISYVSNYYGRNMYKNGANDKLYELPPLAILLIDPDNPPVYVPNIGIYVYCKNSAKPYNLNNINILSPYVPIPTNNKTLFDTFSKESDFKNQVKYLISKNKSVNTAIDSTTSYTKYIYSIINQFYNTSPLTIKSTINKSDLTVNLDTEFNKDQLYSYKDFLKLNDPIDNTILEKINTEFIKYTNSLITSYQYISSDSNNSAIFNELLVLYHMTILYKNQIDANVTLFKNSIDMSSIISFIFTKNESMDKLTYNDIELTLINNPINISENNNNIIYKIRLYPYRIASDTTPVSQSTVLFTEDQVNYVKAGNQIYINKNVFYGTDTYVIRYYYKFIHVIEINDKYIDVYVTIYHTLAKNGVIITDNGQYIFINQQISYLPNNKMDSSEMRYGVQSEDNPNILYVIFYKDGWPLDSGNLVNGKYYLKNYYVSKQLSDSSLENIWFIQQKYSDLIIDIISFPSYYYGKFNIDKTTITTFDSSINGFYIHDIFIMILYNAYKNIISNSNTNVSNILALIIQDIGYLLSSLFKDPYISFIKFITFQPGENSLQEMATLSTDENYSNYSTDKYNLFNISTNSLLLSSEHIYNTAFYNLNRIDNNCLNYISTNMIFNSNKLSSIIVPILTKYGEKIITMDTINFFINNNYNPSNVMNIISTMGQQLPTNSSGKPTALPTPVYKSLDTNPDPYSVLNTMLSTTILNNIYVYNLENTNPQQLINKNRLLSILYTFETNLLQNVSETFMVRNLLINPINSGEFSTKMTYGSLYNIINNAIKSYFQVYFYRSKVLLPMIDPIVFPGSSIDNIIYLFCQQTSDFTDRTSILTTLSNLGRSRIISTSIYNIINTQTVGTNIISTSQITPLIADPVVPDYYTDPISQEKVYLNKSNSLSYYRGVKLITDIISDINILITYESFSAALNAVSLNTNRKLNIISDSLLKSEIYGTGSLPPLQLATIKTKLSDITYYTMMKYTTAQEIINTLKLFDFELNVSAVLNNKNIKLVYYDENNELSTEFVYIGSSINSTTNIIKTNISDFFDYNFINELTKTKLMYVYPNYVDRIINLYNISADAQILDKIFTDNLMQSIINISNTDAYSSILSIISKIEDFITEKTTTAAATAIATTILVKNNNPLNYDQYLSYSNLQYYDKIFYLYNYLITLFYDNSNIDFNSSYDSTTTYTRYNIFFEETDNTFNVNNQFVGPTIKTNFNIFDGNNKKYFNTDYFISITLYNIHSLFNYFSKIVNDPINMSGPFDTLGTLENYIKYYHDNNTQYYPILGLLNYITKYSDKLLQTSIDTNIYNLIVNNSICKIIYDNINLFIFLLINIINTFNLSNLLNDSYSSINNQIYILSITSYIHPTYDVILLPNISTYLTDTYLMQTSNNKIFNYFKGVLEYNINQSMYTNFNQMINDNRQSYIKLYKNLTNVDDIGANTQAYLDLYYNFQSFDYTAETEASAYLSKKSLTPTKMNTSNFKSNNTYMISTGTNDSYKMFVNMLLYFKTNLSSYKSKISDIEFSDIKLDLDKYYSDIDGFYNYIINNIKPSTNVTNILTNLLVSYKNSDATTLNKSLVNILNTEVMNNGILDTTYKKSYISSLSVSQFVDLHNFNKYYNNSLVPNADQDIYSIIKLEQQMAKITDPTYNGINGGNLFIIYKPMDPRIKQIVINDYVGNFFTTDLMSINEKDKATLIQSNTKVSTKLNNAYVEYNYLSKTERFNVIRLYNDLASINGILHYMYNNSIFDINKLKNYPITSIIYNIISTVKYTFYDIIMTEDEYNLIFGSILNYNFLTGSIGILIYDKISKTKYNINLIYQKQKLDITSLSAYEFKLYRKTDIPSEYKFKFGTDPNLMRITSIELSKPIDMIFENLYPQISIYGDNMKNIQKISKALFMVSYIESNNTNILINSILDNLSQNEIIRLIDIIEYYSDIYLISQIGQTINNIYTYLYATTYYINLTAKLANPLKIFNNMYYGTYLQTKVFLSNTPNYCANLTLFLYTKIPLAVSSFYVIFYKINPQTCITIVEYMKYIESTINGKSTTTNIGILIETALKKVYSLVTISVNSANIQKQVISIVGDINQQVLFIYNTNNFSNVVLPSGVCTGKDYNANFINELYQYNAQLGMGENTVLHLMNALFVNNTYKSTYVSIITKLKFINLTVATTIENYVKTLNPSLTYPIIGTDTTTQKVSILRSLNDRNIYYSNLVSMDEQKLILNKIEISLEMTNNLSIIPMGFNNSNTSFNRILINNNMLSESHKLIKINKTPLISVPQSIPSKNPNLYYDSALYKINNITNMTNKIYINYPYNLLFSMPVIDVVNLINNRIANNQIQNNYIGIYNIYLDNQLQTFDVAYINFNTDFLISTLSINGQEYNIKDILIRPLTTLTNTNIPLMYPVTNIIELTFKTDININKNFITSECVQLYINNLNKLYLTYNYFIGDEQTVIKPKIVAIGDTKTYIYMSDTISDSNYVESIELGLQKLLSVEMKSTIIDPKLIPIYNTPYTLYNLLEGFNPNIFIDTIMNMVQTKTGLNRTMATYGNKYYSVINQSLTNTDLMNTMIPSINLSIINSNQNVLNTPFMSTYPELLKNIKNYKFNVFNISDNINPNNVLTTILKSILDDGLKEANTGEISNYNKRTELYSYLLEYINKPDTPTFSYTPYLADFIFDKIDMKIDGKSIDELQSDYMYIYHNMLNNIQKRLGYNKLNLNDERLLIGSETKEEITLYIEVPLYFTQVSGVALPLISTLYSNIELSFKLKNLDDLLIKNKFTNIKFKNNIKLTSIYSIVYLDDYERELFNTMRHEYLYERKIYNTPIQLNINSTVQNRVHVPFNYPIKDYFYYVQLKRMLEAKQYYNYTFNYLLPELNMGTRDKLRYLQQTILNGHYDDIIYSMYLKCVNLMLDKIFVLKSKAPTINIISLGIKTNDLQLLYNNLTDSDITYVENLFAAYFEVKFQEQTIDRSQLYLNSVERFNKSDEYTNMIIPFQSYNNMICGLQIFNFSLHPMEYQPSGYANFSSLRPEFRVELSSNIKLLKSTDILVCHLLARSYNIIRFIGGIAGMAW